MPTNENRAIIKNAIIPAVIKDATITTIRQSRGKFTFRLSEKSVVSKDWVLKRIAPNL